MPEEKRLGLSFLGTGASMRFQAGARGSLEFSKSWSDTESIHTNKNLLLMQGLDAGAMEQAKTEYMDRHGALPEVGSEARDRIYAQAGELFRGDFEDLVKTTQATHAKDVKSLEEKTGSGNETDRWSPADSRRSFQS